MPSYNTDTSNLNTVDPSSIRTYVNSSYRGQSSSGPSAFSEIMNTTVGPAAATAASVSGRGVVSTAISAAAGGSTRYSMNAPTGTSSGALPPPPAPPGMGSSSSSASSALGGTGDMQGQIDAMFNNNMYFLMVQTDVQTKSASFQALSNIVKADFDSKSNAIRNFKA